MSDVSTGTRRRVFVLQSRQPLTTDPAEAFPPDELDVVVLTDGDPADVLREDVAASVKHVVHADRGQWEPLVRSTPGADVVSNDEYCLVACAHLRAATGLPARQPATLDGYRDKVVMKQRLAAAGVPVPRHVTLDPAVTASRATAEQVVAAVGLPAVVKPRGEANSRGVEVLRDADAVRAWLARHDGETGWQVDEYVDGPLGHVNAVVRDGDVVPVQAGRYLGPLLGFERGQVLGGWTLPVDSPLTAAAHELNDRVVRALGADGAFVVHTEFGTGADGRLVVVETAARAPGAAVSEAARVHAGCSSRSRTSGCRPGCPHRSRTPRAAATPGGCGCRSRRDSGGPASSRGRRATSTCTCSASGATATPTATPASAPPCWSRAPTPTRSRPTSSD